ncbi:single-stranded DNA-binding protein [Vibrio nitrifigilis]|uniref:Single-stranded DNA-binding protein n=1 Tax=Vibrio nitrifigilis TaxID=2789781 RepID=A0ABS0GDI6_9VIBR|nr:single-stranded DNA-binding protein [Vibrio nitrifigilis]MBF9000482.1 hypothetical protein [Vibrio nitrifigilis]
MFPENVNVETRNIPAKDNRPARVICEQVAYVHLGGKFPVEMKLQLEQNQPAYTAGTYGVHPSSFSVNQFGGLELKRFGLVIESLGKLERQSA